MNIAKHVTEFVFHGIGVLLNCLDLTRLLPLSSALAVKNGKNTVTVQNQAMTGRVRGRLKRKKVKKEEKGEDKFLNDQGEKTINLLLLKCKPLHQNYLES